MRHHCTLWKTYAAARQFSLARPNNKGMHAAMYTMCGCSLVRPRLLTSHDDPAKLQLVTTHAPGAMTSATERQAFRSPTCSQRSISTAGACLGCAKCLRTWQYENGINSCLISTGFPSFPIRRSSPLPGMCLPCLQSLDSHAQVQQRCKMPPRTTS